MSRKQQPKPTGDRAIVAALARPLGRRTSDFQPHYSERGNATFLSLEKMRLKELPPEICQLTQLQRLDLSDNGLTALPPEISQLTQLLYLVLDGNGLTALPPEIGQLTQLQTLYLMGNRLTALPPEIDQLTQLQMLYLGGNGLTVLPPEIGQLTQLHTLYLRSNGLTALPPEIGRLTQLHTLYLSGNGLTALPPEIGQLTQLRTLDLDGNPELTSPPPEVVAQGTQAVLAYLRELLESGAPQWVSKLLVVGDPGVGKTQLLRALREEGFVEGSETTHGIEVGTLELEHSTEGGVRMQLNTWDFGGQEIYHATHQFFLSNRSLFLLVWNARLDYVEAHFTKWLDTIKALAPDSPILIVATHTDQRAPALPIQELTRRYQPQIVGHYAVSNRSRNGVPALREAIREAAATLPLMGEPWPPSWLAAANALRERAKTERTLTPLKLRGLFEEHGVAEDARDVLATWLHELGDILYFRDREDLKDLVILQPQWVTQYISKVLESPVVQAESGVFSRDHMEDLWSDLEPEIQEHFLQLMERFDLSYQTLDNREISLVVERLPHDAPAEYPPHWDALREAEGCHEVTLKFRLNIIPAGVPTWLIARQHRFTTLTHWRSGALFAYPAAQPGRARLGEDPERRHLALLRNQASERVLELTVRGPTPHNFLALLRDGVEAILERFPGLEIRRTIPCPCPGRDGRPCTNEFELENLERALSEQIEQLQCQSCFQSVSVSRLLFGLAEAKRAAGVADLERTAEKIIGTLITAGQKQQQETREQLAALIQREFLQQFHREQSLSESHCPNVFLLLPRDPGNLLQRLAGRRYDLKLLCQQPGCWHPVTGRKRLAINEPAEWLRTVGPHARRLFKALKYVAPLVGPWLGVAPAEVAKEFEKELDLMEALVEKLPELEAFNEAGVGERLGGSAGSTSFPIETRDGEERGFRADWEALRALRNLIGKHQPGGLEIGHVGGLKKVLTPENHYLWLCDYHATEYER